TKLCPIYTVQTNEKKVALTFDAAWGSEDTPTLCNILKENGATATFFLVGQWVDKYPESVKQLSDCGFEIGNHSSTHPYFSKISKSEIIKEVQGCNEKIKTITGKSPTVFRMPYGDYNNAAVSAVGELGMYSIQWTCDSKDWMQSATKESIVKDALKNLKPGTIILFHNAAQHAPEALPEVIAKLKAEGYTFCTVSDLIYKDNYTINHAGEQVPVQSTVQ
ncbi:MAG: polysaccharide deacetylase family protein, partial [Oscillospiraceae bacterium]|nr:polysaccharide deacetylase family protein [Candidatus Equicaccousia limihippi]